MVYRGKPRHSGPIPDLRVNTEFEKPPRTIPRESD